MRKRLHTRKIKVEAFQTSENTILVEGCLDDDHPFPFPRMTREDMHPPGTVHDMRVELEVKVPDFIVTAVRADMKHAPDEGCREILPAVQSLVGLQIGGGFTRAVKERLGGPRGCAHLGSLIVAVAPVASMAFGGIQHSKGADEQWIWNSPVLNTCHMWREGGPYHQALEAKKAAKAGEPNITD